MKENFKQKLKFLKPAYFSLTSTSEFIMSSDDSVLSNCLSAVLLGCDKQKSLLIKNCAKAVSEEVQDRLSSQERQLPPTLEEKSMNSSYNKLFNLITLIVNPNLLCDKSGTVRLCHVETIKVSKICDDIEPLISNLRHLPY